MIFALIIAVVAIPILVIAILQKTVDILGPPKKQIAGGREWDMKKRIAVIGLIAVVGLSGCSVFDTGGVTQVGNNALNQSTSRFGSWERAEIARLSGIVAIRVAEFQARQAEAEAKKAAIVNKPEPQILINTEEGLRIYERIKMVDALAEANRLIAQSNQALADVAIALAGGDRLSALMMLSDMPEGAFAEFAKAIGTAGKDLANTPLAVILGAVQLARSAGDKVGGDKASGSGTIDKHTEANVEVVPAEAAPASTAASTTEAITTTSE